MRETIEMEKVDPFGLTLELYRALDDQQDWALTQRLYALYGPWIEEQFRDTGAALLVLSDRQVIYASADRYDPHADTVVEETERRTSKPAYIVTRLPIIEEHAAWSDLRAQKPNDFYPTVEVYLANRAWRDDEVFHRGARVIADFDTGNPMIYAFPETICGWLAPEARPRRHDLYLGRPYRFYPRLLKLGMTDGVKKAVLERTVDSILGWDDLAQNPFRLANPQRAGFVGRELMLETPFRLLLDPGKKESSWELL